MLAIGLFFSVYFRQNSLISVLTEDNAEAFFSQTETPLILPKTTVFKFDPMNRVKVSMEKLELEKQKEREEKVKQESQKKEPENGQLETYQKLVSGSPIEEMLPFIAKCDSETASFLIAIAKKESDFGRYSPQKNGRSCFNFWGYRGTYNQTASGYSCFDSPEQAIEVVGGKIRELLDKKIDTAEKMVVWKCGSTCAGHDPASVRKWISDVALYRQKANS
ncbi:MAG: hypothetical protein WC848_00845 [Parcubacteria group bacterium]